MVFDHLLTLMTRSATLFGATIVQDDAPRSRAAQMVMNFYNSKGIFSNAEDTAADLENELRKRFGEVRLVQHGAAFEARSV